MLAKILAGVLAAVVVTGVGYYYSMPDNSVGCCKGKVSTPGNTETLAPIDCASSCPADNAPCCSLTSSKTECSDALSACIGGMATMTTTTASNTTIKLHCCTE